MPWDRRLLCPNPAFKNAKHKRARDRELLYLTKYLLYLESLGVDVDSVDHSVSQVPLSFQERRDSVCTLSHLWRIIPFLAGVEEKSEGASGS